MDSSNHKNDDHGLLLEPSNELRFKGPFDDFVTVTLTVRNPTDRRIAFKIKTTAPKRYCVKPNSGVLDPAASTKVNVLLQPFTYDPNDKTKHKFMVQYIYLNEEESAMNSADILNMWKDVQNDRLLDIKLKCIFDFDGNVSAAANSSDQQAPSILQQTASKQSTTVSEDRKQQQAVANSVRSRNTDSNSSSSSSINHQQKSQQQQQQQQQLPIESTSSESTSLDNMSSTTDTFVAQSLSSSGRADNQSNELKVTKNENEKLRKEIEKLKEDQNRLRKLALQDSSKQNTATTSSSSSSSSSLKSTHAGDQSLTDMLNNKFVWIIVVLLAIIFYLSIQTMLH